MTFRVLGTPTESQWPGLATLPGAQLPLSCVQRVMMCLTDWRPAFNADYKPIFPSWKTNKLRDSVPSLDDAGVDLVQVSLHREFASNF